MWSPAGSRRNTRSSACTSRSMSGPPAGWKAPTRRSWRNSATRTSRTWRSMAAATRPIWHRPGSTSASPRGAGRTSGSTPRASTTDRHCSGGGTCAPPASGQPALIRRRLLCLLSGQGLLPGAHHPGPPALAQADHFALLINRGLQPVQPLLPGAEAALAEALVVDLADADAGTGYLENFKLIIHFFQFDPSPATPYIASIFSRITICSDSRHTTV